MFWKAPRKFPASSTNGLSKLETASVQTGIKEPRRPSVNPKKIGIGKPGKIPFFFSIMKVRNDPTRTPAKESRYGAQPPKSVFRSMTEQSIE